nr:hypothetical protein [Algoriphagus terrigena]
MSEQALPEAPEQKPGRLDGQTRDRTLPVPYFHLVFTVADTLNQLAMHQPKAVYDSLFEVAWKTVDCFA